MKLKLILGSFAMFLMVSLNSGTSQNVVALESSGVTSIYNHLDSAMNHAVAGDILYLSGGSYTPVAGTLVISKNVNIIGAGHYPDSTLATGRTVINGNIQVQTNASGGMMEGLYITGELLFAPSGNNYVNGYRISRCFIYERLMLSHSQSTPNPTVQNIFLEENVIRNYVYFAEAKNLSINKNIFQSYISGVSGQATFRNNIFLLHATTACTSTPTFNNLNGALMYDNIIVNIGCSGISSGTFSGNSFYNNIFSSVVSFPIGNNQGTDNIIGEPIDSVFVAHTFDNFSYINNYHLFPTSPGINGGSDGTDIGIFGTAFPYKEGSVPFNPHIQSQVIAPATNSQGKLNINIKVKAQDR
ncbi:MAG: hypothetical protein IPN29_15560 [Saprospiraceae bacterium]|nr:hypothetical protein [Saprospiraceae bacterium]